MRFNSGLFIGVFLLLLLRSQFLFGQINLRLSIATYDHHPIESAELLVQEGDSIVQFSIIKTQEYVLSLPKAGRYNIQLANAHYETFQIEQFFSTDSVLNVVLEGPTIALDEVSVVGKSRPRVTATGEVFRLSKKAKSSGNPFRALSEIPLLQVDISSQSIKMRSGESPLILVDGHLVNSGVQPIHPENIESVEVSEVVSARYLQMGVTKIVNIRLRENIPLYSFVDVRTRHDIPPREGFGGANFEFGKKVFAIAGSFFADYLVNDRVRYKSMEQMEQRRKELSGESVSRSKGIDGHLLVKWLPAPSDYVSAILKIRDNRSRTDDEFGGTYVALEKTSSLTTSGRKRTIDGGLLASLFHEHTFGDKSTLTSWFKYNRGKYDLNQDYLELYGDNQITSLVDLATLRNQYALSVDYDSGEQPFGSIAVGNNLEYTWDKITNRSLPSLLTSYVGLGSNYTHATYSNQWKQLYYMVSFGLQGLAVKTVDKNHSYWRPRAAVSLSLRLPNAQSLRGSYYLTNRLPESRNLVSFNLSTNPWFREEGNPFLVPMQIHQFDLNYNYSLRDCRLWLFGNHSRYSRMIEPYVRREGDYQIKSYRNNGTYARTNGGIGISYTGDNLQISTTASYTSEVFNGQSPKGSYGVRGHFRWDFGDFFVYSSLSWRNRSYTSISQTYFKNPVESHVQIAWQANEQLYLSLGLPYFWGIRSSVTEINQPAYMSHQQTFFQSESLRPWLLISWTFRKNPKLAIPEKTGDL